MACSALLLVAAGSLPGPAAGLQGPVQNSSTFDPRDMMFTGNGDLILHTKWGPSPWGCPHGFDPTSADECGGHPFQYSKVLNGPFHLPVSSFQGVFIGAPNSPQASCKFGGGMLKKPAVLRTTVDSRYTNIPRCCTSDQDRRGLIGLDTGVGPKAAAISKSWPRVLAGSIPYYRVNPFNRKCSSMNRCGLVMSLPGIGGETWLFNQLACPKCKQSLATVLLAPASDPLQLTGKMVMGAVNHALRDGAIDKNKVYLVSISFGNDLGLKIALDNPHVFAMATFAGQFNVSRSHGLGVNKELIKKTISTPNRRLKSLQFHIGDQDRGWPLFWHQFGELMKQFPDGFKHDPMVDLHLYLEAEHAVWLAAWNTLHDVLWLGDAPSYHTHHVSATCSY